MSDDLACGNRGAFLEKWVPKPSMRDQEFSR